MSTPHVQSRRPWLVPGWDIIHFWILLHLVVMVLSMVALSRHGRHPQFESITFFIALGGFFLTCLLVNLFYKSSYYDETKRYRCWKFFIHFAASFLVNIVIATLLTVRFVREGLCIDFRKYAEDEDPPAVSESLRVGSIVILIFVWIFIPIMFAVAFIVLRNLQKISVDAMPMNSLELGQYRSAPHQTAHGEKWEDIPL